MAVTIIMPPDLERRSLPDRCHWWAGIYRTMDMPNLPMIALLEEAECEFNLHKWFGPRS